MRKTFQTNKAPGGVAPLSTLTVGGLFEIDIIAEDKKED